MPSWAWSTGRLLVSETMPAFGGVVDGHLAVSELVVHQGDEHDGARLLRDHSRQHGLAGGPRALQVDREHLVPLLLGRVSQRGEVAVRGVGYEHINEPQRSRAAEAKSVEKHSSAIFPCRKIASAPALPMPAAPPVMIATRLVEDIS